METNWQQSIAPLGTATRLISRLPDDMKADAASVGELIRVCTHLEAISSRVGGGGIDSGGGLHEGREPTREIINW